MSEGAALAAVEAVGRACDLAWAAGVLDARGSLLATARKHPGGWTPVIRVKALRPWLRQDPPEPLLVALVDVFGGHVCRPARVGSVWQVTGAKACVEVIDGALPFLRANRGRAVALRRLCLTIRDYQRPGFDDRTIAAAEVKTRLQLAEALRTAV